MRERGEGIVLRAPRSPYVHGRSSDVVKVKVCAAKEKEGERERREMRREERKEVTLLF